MARSGYWLLGLGLGAVALSCKPKELHKVSTTAYIVGASNDIKKLDDDTRRNAPLVAQHAAVLIATRMVDKRVKFCSGTLIPPEEGKSNYRVLSNHHCFAEPDKTGKATRVLLQEACAFTKVYFDFLPGQTRESINVPCLAGSLRTNFEGDLSVFTLAQNPPDKFKPLDFWEGGDAIAGRKAVIVHYPDVEESAEVPPDGTSKLPTAAITADDCTVLGAFDVSEWDLDRTLPFSLRHTCDLIHGSSGSALVDLETGTLLGVNWGGIKITTDDNKVRTDNVATQVSFVTAFLSNKAEEAIRTAQSSRFRGEALAQPTKAEDSRIEEKGKKLTDGVKSPGCGVLGLDGNVSAPGVSLALLAVPLLGLLALRLWGAGQAAAVRVVAVRRRGRRRLR